MVNCLSLLFVCLLGFFVFVVVVFERGLISFSAHNKFVHNLAIY